MSIRFEIKISEFRIRYFFDSQLELIKSEYDESRNYFYGDFDRKAEGNCIRNPGKSEHECCGGHRKGSKVSKK